MKINASSKSLDQRLCDFKIYAISVLSFIGSVCAPDKANLKAEKHAIQCTTAGPYNAIPSTLLGVGSVCGFGPDLVGIHPISVAARYRVAACSTTLSRGLEKINTVRGHHCTTLFALSPVWEKNFLFPPWPWALRLHLILFVGWTVMTHLMKFRKTKRRRMPLVSFWTNFINKTLLGLYLVATWNLFRVLLVLDYSLVSFASYVMGSALHRDFTLKNMITHVVLDAQMSLTLSHVTVYVPGCTTFLFLETCYDVALKKSFSTRLGHPFVPAQPSIWNCGTGFPWCFCLCPS